MSTLDVANKLLDIISEEAKWGEEDYECLCDAAYKLWTMDHDAAGKFVGSVTKHAESFTKFLTEFTRALINDASSRWDDFIEFAILSGEPSLFASEDLAGKAASDTDIPSAIIRLLSVKNFAAASALLPRLPPGQDVNVEDAAGSLPQSLKCSDELSNLVQLLFVMAQRKGVPKSMFSETKQHYAKVIHDNPGISSLLTAFESVYWPAAIPRRQQPDNPMASMLQNLLSGVQ